LGEKKLKSRNKIGQKLKIELSKIGYSDKAIDEIGKWIVLE
jgi:hypothetical protein